MGYVIEINQTETDYPCPLCGHWQRAKQGLVVVQRPSGDIVCEDCAERDLKALHIETGVLEEDTPTDFPDIWPSLEHRLAVKQAADPDLGLLLEMVALQRFTGPGQEDRYRPDHPSIGSALGTMERPTSVQLYTEAVEAK